MRFTVHAGHNPDGKRACGAVGLIKESTENRRVKDEVIRLLKLKGHTIYDCTIDNGTSVSDIVNKQVSKMNSYSNIDLHVSIHFNSGANDKTGNGKSTGTEVLIYNTNGTKNDIAKRICSKIGTLGYKNRGVKIRTNLGVLSKTKAPALLVECCFVDDKDDVALYNYKTMAKAIAEGILNETIVENVPTNSDTKNDNTYVVDCDILNVRYGRGTEYEVAGKLKRGDKIEIWKIEKDKKGENWGSFRYSFTPDIIGYVSMTYLKKE